MDTTKRDFECLMLMAQGTEDIMTIAFAGVISMMPMRRAPYNVPIAGLSQSSLDALMQQFFPGTCIAAPLGKLIYDEDSDEFLDLVTLLLEHRTIRDDQSTWLAHAVATACMADNHLWQDMGLPSRVVLSKLLNTYFTSLAQRNTGDMKWKKFFYRQLCERSGLTLCRSPSCGVCTDYSKCFGSEETASDPVCLNTTMNV